MHHIGLYRFNGNPCAGPVPGLSPKIAGDVIVSASGHEVIAAKISGKRGIFRGVRSDVRRHRQSVAQITRCRPGHAGANLEFQSRR
jgi:hypothetical protein